MKQTRAGAPVAAGETRGKFGAALDARLPMPGRRRSFRRWRPTRPFWAGVLGGILIIAYPLGPPLDMVALGSAALTGVAIGLILVIGGLFFFAPEQQMFIAIVLMICSVLSLVASNLGGFLLGMVLGMVGSSMAFGWKPAGERRRGGSAPAEDPKPSPVPRQGSRNSGNTAVSTATLNAKDVQVRGTTFVEDGCGNRTEVVDLYIPGADLTGYVVNSPGQTFRIATDMHIERIELATPELTAHIDIAGLVTEQLGISAELLPPILRPKVGPVPITPELVNALQSLGLATAERPLVINSLVAAPATWVQPIIRGGDVHLANARLFIEGRPPIIG
ncbi:MAG: hypothetical protein GEU86_14695 [Actinophytocola sp.]|nr:hypothetical protein [Actinophytocola sp.]